MLFGILLASLVALWAHVPDSVHGRAPIVVPEGKHAGGLFANLTLFPLDQDSTTIVVAVAHPGGRIDAFVNAVFVGGAPASRITRVPIRGHLRPGAIVSVYQSGFGRTPFATASVKVLNNWLTYHYINTRTGWNRFENTLTVANVNPTTFGALFTMPVDGNIYAEPLYGEKMSAGGANRNLLFVATENDSVYAFDGDSGLQLWKRSLVDPGAAPIPSVSISCGNVKPIIGITGTPVVDRIANTMYVVAALSKTVGGVTTQYHMLHALNTVNGTDRPGSPVQIAATVTTTSGAPLSFDSLYELQRPALLLLNGTVYIGFGSHCDNNPATSYGWVLAYDATSLALKAVFNSELDTASAHFGSVWQSGFGLSVDPLGFIYLAAGNGPFDGNTGGHDWGYSILKLRSSDLTIADYFTTFDWATLGDKEAGSGGVMILPVQTGPIPNLAIQVGKGKRIFLLNRDDLGQFTPGGPNRVVQELDGAAGVGAHGVFGGPAYYNGPNGQSVFICANQDYMKAFSLTTSPGPHLTRIGQTPDIFPGIGGCIPTVSSSDNAAGTGIVWTTTRPDDPSTQPIMLRAYDATNLSHELFQAAAGQWLNPNGQPFMAPTVINGKVFVGSANAVTAFGLKP